MKQIAYATFIWGLLAANIWAAPAPGETTSFRKEGLSSTIYSSTVDLPAEGLWAVDYDHAEGPVATAFATPEEEAYRQFDGNRMGEVMLEEHLNSPRGILSSLHYQYERYARTNDNTGPVSADLLPERVADRLENLPWEVPADKGGGPYIHLIASVPFEYAERGDQRWGTATNETLLAVELRPYLDDGKHWVLYANDVCRREEIDARRMAALGVEVRPVFTRRELFPDAPETFAYTFDMMVTGDTPAAVTLPLTNLYTGAGLTLDWTLADAAAGDDSSWRRYREAQVSEWLAYWEPSDSPVLAAWIAAAGETEALRPPRQRGRRGEETSIFGVLGGEAAVRETLQMRLIEPATNDTGRMMPIADIQSVTVKSHPYEEMLGEDPGGSLALAERVPADRFFAYIAKPEAILPLLNKGADFIAQLGSAQTGSSIRYHLKERYLKRLGLTEAFLETILRSGVISECAVTAPDLFFIDGTEITVISRLTRFDALAPLLKLVGVSVKPGEVLALDTPEGPVYWALQGDLLLLGTDRAELEQTLALEANKGEGSLGQSAEFRYMLTQLPLSESTRMYVYLSDPFIRRLVGPQVKIAQLRRATEMIRMRHLTAAAMLARADGLEACRDPDALKAHGYLPDRFSAEGIMLDDELVAHSVAYGTLAHQKPITQAPVTAATEAEEEAYQAYVAGYSRFWRQFFDPIALLLNDTADGALEAEVFILPLIDSSIYNGLRAALAPGGEGASLTVPELQPAPVLQCSVNLNEMAWRGVGQTLGDILSRFIFIDPAILDDLGSGVHLMVMDADPVIALGSGDLLGAFGAGLDGEELFIPMALSVLTRPCVLAVETRNPERTATYLRNAAHSEGRDWEVRSEFYQVGDGDQWVCLFDLMGMIRLRYGLEVKGSYLLIRNIPWSSRDEVVATHPADLDSLALRLTPGAVRRQLPGLYATDAEKSRAEAMRGLGLLYPFVREGGSLDDAQALHMKRFGHAPYMPSGDTWSWRDGVMESALYGSVFRRKQPPHSEGDAAFGLLGTIDVLNLSAQFEDSGYRARVRWKTR